MSPLLFFDSVKESACWNIILISKTKIRSFANFFVLKLTALHTNAILILIGLFHCHCNDFTWETFPTCSVPWYKGKENGAISIFSVEYLFFVPACALLYRVLPKRLGIYVLLAACAFYYLTWTPAAFPILLGVAAVSFLGGLWLQKCQKKRGAVLAGGIILTVAALLVCKYAAFFTAAMQSLLRRFSISVSLQSPNFLLPVGISFFTLQAVSYLVDVYKQKLSAERNFLFYFLYMSFFPSVTSGPICRAGALLPQFRQKHMVTYSQVKHACLRMLRGYFLKLVIANRISPWVTLLYAAPEKYAGLPVWSTVVLYAFEIYTDFAGYTDIALGAAELFGFRLPENFDMPYLFRSMREFWRRWHISFSTWLRDYIYIPLGGSRCSKLRKYGNVLVTFTVSGFWHGASWNFVLWGMLHGIYQVFGGILAPLRARVCAALHLSPKGKLHIFLSTLFTFGLADFAWIFFRAESVSKALRIVKSLFYSAHTSFLSLVSAQFANGIAGFALVVGCLVLMAVLEMVQYSRGPLYPKWLQLHGVLQWLSVFVLLWVVLVCGVYGPGYSAQSFIYAKF